MFRIDEDGEAWTDDAAEEDANEVPEAIGEANPEDARGVKDRLAVKSTAEYFCLGGIKKHFLCQR